MRKVDLKTVIVDQKEEVERIFLEERIIEREFLPSWKRFMESPLIKVITGVRRAGKSVLSFQLLRDRRYAYINFDDERLAGMTSSDLNMVLQVFYEWLGDFQFILLDEVQNIEGWELFVNRIKRQGFHVLVTGSNAKLLSQEFATHLTGRHLCIEVFPFSFREFLVFENFKVTEETFYSTRQKSFLIKKLEEYLKIGGFPEVVKNKENARNYLATLYSTILITDVVSRYRIKYIKTLKEISNYLVSNFANFITFNKIKNLFGLRSVHTSKNYVSYLEDAYLFFLLDKFSFKHKEVLASPKKVYVIDSGIINTLAFRVSENFGRLIENTVAVELLRRKSLNPLLEIYYWRDYSGKEVDFIVKNGLKVKQLIQVTYASSKDAIERRELSALLKAGKELICNNLLVITWDYEDEEIVENRKIVYKPLYKWLLENA
ncbi:MAG: ATP-binding protein [Methanosarcinales archaeon]